MKIFGRNRTQDTAEEETEIDPTAEAGTTQERTTETTTEMVVETTTEIEVETAETTVEIEIETEVEEETDLIQEREEKINLDLDQVKDTLTEVRRSFCNRSGHLAHNCFRLENYLKRKGKKIVLQDDDDDVEEISQAVQYLNTKLNSLK